MSTPLQLKQGEIKRRGLMLILSSPSGAGKTAISRHLLAEDDNLDLSISCTTRAPRPGEEDGVHYHFISPEKFESMVQNDEFLEHATVFGHRYGTPRAPVEKALSDGRDILFDIDWQGTQQIGQRSGADMVSVFILPPSLDELEQRLRKRAQDSEEVIKTRMSKAADEMSHWPEYEYIIVNRDFENSIRRIKSILRAERLKTRRLEGLAVLVNKMRAEQTEE